ncbi:DnaD domain-containing protein [Cohnella lubricantis]|uniref:DnaD domain-containing protein n=1 Tax=Cohnella lubricantis TaxID=2163172 RepID=A0A841THN9_9BACL|nr:DnaD domain-containing protein [Cohnella lubricantis]MBB6679665.1 DnaD domain-containing protein [Cohnella lubricantis]MBP2119907.1 DNA replication protein [Cohnella lubricantis]
MVDRGLLARGLAEAYMDGAVSLPYALLRSYRLLKLTDSECMLIIQLLAFKQLEQNEFPTMEQLQERLGSSPATVGQAMQKLVKHGFVSIDEVFDKTTGVQSERYNLTGLFQKIAALLAAEELPLRGSSGTDAEPVIAAARPASSMEAGSEDEPNLFAVFEQEFGRPLTPMECETIGGWIDTDGYSAELILFALKESVFAGKLHFRYIDRILLEWSRNRVNSVEDARAHAQKFRGGAR